ncbi:SNF2 family N-terminal domain-containing protein [Phascolomyces articulosus]|uniref:SNF2 family N-terminal domain-containing protein n=1 Tax=Phascolomyces articulosus TaxID=60185 RepID=A0AAD5JUD4_9FUNG|nr:SNF2 family N-terminal domain-containing protein [Phascolomyces articulosus]
MLIDGTIGREALVQLLFESRSDEERVDNDQHDLYNDQQERLPETKRRKLSPKIDILHVIFPIQISSTWSDLLNESDSTTIPNKNLSIHWTTEPITIVNEQFTKAQMTLVFNNDHSNYSVTLADNEVLVYSTDQSNLFLTLARVCSYHLAHTSTSIRVRGINAEAHMTVSVELDRVQGNQMFFNLLNLVYPSSITAPSSTSVEDFFHHLQPKISSEFLPAYQPEGLVPKLAPFQSQNVEWMLAREGHKAVNGRIDLLEQQLDCDVPFLWEKIKLDNGRLVFVNRISRNIIIDPTEDFNDIQALTRRGGVLADEMGLGKTVCAIALILLHKLDQEDPTHPKGTDGLITTAATLIITPSAIIRQWESEFQKHAPSLRVITYQGIKAAKNKEIITAEEMAQYHVVLTDYNVLKEEIHHARVPPNRPRRHVAKYPAKRSPLTQILWFRVMLDEAQMVESSTTLVGEMARLIPRWYSWGVTGTPMKSSFDDLFGLILFLGFTPSIHKSRVFEQLYKPDASTWAKGLFWKFSKTILRRNIKVSLADQVHIPAQHRNIVKLAFSAIEQHYYQSIWDQCSRSCNLRQLNAINWTPSDNNEDLETSAAEIQRTFIKLRTWLLALRQACDHPAVGNAKRRVINQTVRTLTEVLDALIEQAKDDFDNTSATLIGCKLRRGGMHEMQKKWKDALDIYLAALPQTSEMLDVINGRIEEAKVKQEEGRKKRQEASAASNQADPPGGSSSSSHNILNKAHRTHDPFGDVLTALTARQSKWLSYLHRFYFYIAGIYHELEMEEEEVSYYDKAADVRKQILTRVEDKVISLTRELPKISIAFDNTIGQSEQQEALVLSFDRLDRINTLCGSLDSQLSHINEWRVVLSELLHARLVDQGEEQKEITGDEYETSLITQQKLDLYQDAYQAILRDRNFLVNGIWATGLQQVELFKDVTEWTEAEEIVTLKVELSEIRQNYMPKTQTEDNLRTIISELKEIISRPGLHEVEKNIIRIEYNRLNKAASKQRELQDKLEIEYRRFNQLYNTRIEYYRSLQEISDLVKDWESKIGPVIEAQRLEYQEGHHEKRIKEQSARCRYLENLAKEKDQENKCLICQSDFSKGLMTYCGHMYCQECATIWFRLHQRCPQCNSPTKLSECYAIAWDTSNENKEKTEENGELLKEKENQDVDKEISNELLGRISQCAIEEGLGAKLDSIIRHIKYIISSSNGKSVVFSQWGDVLNLIADGLKKNNINFVRVDNTVRDDRIKQFSEDPNIHVILLHSRSQSSGLTLICAQTVFIVEPVLNEAMERQAISRVHRIGQTQETNVYWYIIQETIEERIHAIYSARHKRKIRMEQEGREDLSDETIPLATQSEGGGERVADEDLQRCFTSNESWTTNL